jgi:hypothetical protein
MILLVKERGLHGTMGAILVSLTLRDDDRRHLDR